MISDPYKEKIIAWDFDGVLYENDNKEEEKLYEFILSTPNINHFIVTHRSHGMEDEIPSLLFNNNFDSKIFKKIYNVPDGHYENRHFDSQYYLWKAKICKEIGSNILIDDNFDASILGAKKYNITIIHPFDFVLMI